jgi:protein O-GlcNAc transferase
LAVAAHHFQRAVASLQQGHFDEAEALCNEILRADRKHFDALHVLGLVALQRGQVDRALELIGKSIQINPRQAVAHLNMGNALLRLGRPQGALASCDRALALRPDYAEALNNRGTALLELKRPLEALADYERALRLRPDLPIFHNNRGNALRDLKRTGEALASYDRALQLQPDFDEALLGRATILRLLQRPTDALATAEQLLRLKPDHAETLHLLGSLLLDLDRTSEALPYLDRALQLQPDSAAMLVNRGNALFKLQRTDEALASYERVLELAPSDADAAYNRGNALMELKRFDDALASYDRSLRFEPDFPQAHYYRGVALRRLKRPEEALASYAQALQRTPNYAEALSGMGNALRDLNRPAEAQASYEKALQLDPQCVDALSNLARILLSLNRPEEAGKYFEQLFETAPDVAPDYNHGLGMLLHSGLMCCDWRDYEATVAAILAGLTAGKGVTLPSLLLATSQSPEIQLRCARLFVEDNWAASAAPSWTGERYRHDRVRLAYVSADFRQHPVSYLMAGVLELHDGQRFETIAISLRPEESSPIGQRVKAAFSRFIDVSKLSDREIATLMRDLEVDIAVDLTGYTDGSRPGIFAHRPAPVQVNYLGYAGTIAAPYFDYIIADRVVIPDTDQRFYTERVAYLPHSYMPHDAKRAISERTPTRAQCGLPGQGFVFCCFNAHYKIAPGIFEIWMRLLRSVEGSVLWLSDARESVIRNLRQEASKQGVAGERLVFAPRVPDMEDHLARHRIADLFLDTLPFNAHTTASDALWAGLPVLTCQGKSFAGRVASSLLTAVGLPELITTNLQDYEALAIRLATTPSLLAQYRAHLERQHEVAPLFDTDRFRRDLESAYLRMWECWQRGEPATYFSVESAS